MALRRQVIHVPGVERSHSPIPEGARIGDLVFSSLLAPGDASSHEGEGTVPAAIALFERIANLLRAAGGSADHLADLAVYVLDDEDRPSINAAWVKMLPNPDRPSRRILNVAPKGVGAVRGELHGHRSGPVAGASRLWPPGVLTAHLRPVAGSRRAPAGPRAAGDGDVR